MTSPVISTPLPPLLLEQTHARPHAWRGKRAFDVLVSLLLLLLALPLFALVALAIATTSRGPVFFRQKRVGFGGETFEIVKFRTMRVGAEQVLAVDEGLRQQYLQGDHKIAGRDDPRVTRVGRLLRKLSLDELPQLANVVRGDMSLIGPRPVRPDEVAEYHMVPYAYLSVRPGMTGLWQVSGRSDIAFPRRAEIDAEYYRRCSLGTDLLILARTVVAVLACRGAS